MSKNALKKFERRERLSYLQEVVDEFENKKRIAKYEALELAKNKVAGLRADLASLTHGTQVETFGWCSCEDCDGETPFQDCPK